MSTKGSSPPSHIPGGDSMLFRPFMKTPEHQYVPERYRHMRHPFFAWTGVRPVVAQHTRAEHEALQRWVQGRKAVMEIGVAEGASALALRESMAADGTLYLIDPYHLSRIHWLNLPRRAAHACVNMSKNGRVRWIQEFSTQAAVWWNGQIDFLFFDGDHEEAAVREDWRLWHTFLQPGAVAVFHDARVFRDGWPAESDGPVKFVDGLFRQQNLEWKIVDEVHSLVVIQRSA